MYEWIWIQFDSKSFHLIFFSEIFPGLGQQDIRKKRKKNVRKKPLECIEMFTKFPFNVNKVEN